MSNIIYIGSSAGSEWRSLGFLDRKVEEAKSSTTGVAAARFVLCLLFYSQYMILLIYVTSFIELSFKIKVHVAK